MAEIKMLLEKPWLHEPLADEPAWPPTMLSGRELQLLYWLAKHYADGDGQIVDAGAFLGGSTVALARGIADRAGGPQSRVVSYDRFIIDPYALSCFGAFFSNPKIGESFRCDFDRYTSRWSQHIDVKHGDAVTIGWSGEPIEVLFLDMAKTWRLNYFVLDEMMPCLIPGHSILIQQDYLWGFAPWLHITMELMQSCVTMLDYMANGTVAYLVTEPLPDIANKLRNLGDDDKLALMNDAIDRWDGEERGLVELARVMLLAETDQSAAQRELAVTISRHRGEPRVELCAGGVANNIADNAKGWLRG